MSGTLWVVFVVFVVLECLDVIDWPWYAISAPLWIWLILAILIYLSKGSSLKDGE